ncbi:DUF397 domain-containing protein [Actinomadura graeca]|uniref:DUF397 domain-containing protein n=1 Tax=Actinomadura graeca TaxID=2750812 RepID=A0ABX8QZG7_9ACTN|nr:DUF397 domain-containing protein [Actinomadura graeca]QXJ23584.1 DUF397 domain-containing protein [Actinomadura graeca]
MIVWRKASQSDTSGGDCVEIAQLPENIGVRDSKNPLGPAFALSPTSFRALVHDVKTGNHDTP